MICYKLAIKYPAYSEIIYMGRNLSLRSTRDRNIVEN